MICAAKLKRVLSNDAVIVPWDDGKGELVLQEGKGKEVVMSVTVVGDSTEMIAIPMSTASRRIGLLRDVSGKWNLSCDYSLLGKVDAIWYAVFVELKKTFRPDSRPKEQLRWSLPILDYIRQTCELELRRPIIRPRVNYVLLFEQLHPLIDKQPTKGLHRPMDPEEWRGIIIRKFIGSRFRFRDLVGSD